MISLTDKEKEVIKKNPIGRKLDGFYEVFSEFAGMRPSTSSNRFKDIISSVGEDEGTFL